MKKLLGTIIALICFSAAIPTFAAAELPESANTPGKNQDTSWVSPFSDVKNGDWFYEDVRYVYTNGLMAGTNGTLFSPGTNATRAMIAAILRRARQETAVISLPRRKAPDSQTLRRGPTTVRG